MAPSSELPSLRSESPVRRSSSLVEEVAAHIREQIITGSMRPGEVIRMDVFAESFGVSATPVREALGMLRGQGFVQFKPRRGYVVAPLSRQDLIDMFELQASVAGELAARAATRLNATGVSQLAGIQRELEVAARRGDTEGTESLNYQLHRAINRSARSQKLTWVLGTIAQYAPRTFYGAIPGWSEASAEDHYAILAALGRRSSKIARTAMEHHITHAGQLLVTHLDSIGLWTDGILESPTRVPLRPTSTSKDGK